MTRLLFLLLVAPLLAACETTGGGSVMGGECRAFERPEHEIRGATQHDQDWIDPTIESGVGACKWARPAPRPAEWDTPKPVKKPKAAPVKKKSPVWLQMLRPTTPAVAEPAVVEPPPPVVAPRSPIDQLLHPSVMK